MKKSKRLERMFSASDRRDFGGKTSWFREYEISACDGKVGYESYSSAGKAIRIDNKLKAYKCDACGKWHVGRVR